MNLPAGYARVAVTQLKPLLLGRIPSNPSMGIPVSSFPCIKPATRASKRSAERLCVEGSNHFNLKRDSHWESSLSSVMSTSTEQTRAEIRPTNSKIFLSCVNSCT